MAQGWKLHKGALTNCPSLPSGGGVKFEGDLDVLTSLHRRRVAQHIAGIAERIAPGIVVYCGHTIRKEDGGTLYGQAICGRVVLLGMTGYIPSLVETAYHELWHIVEDRYLTECELAFVDAELNGGGSWFGCDYLDDGAERAARAFASWAMMWENGLPPHEYFLGSIYHLFDRVLVGEVGKRPPVIAAECGRAVSEG